MKQTFLFTLLLLQCIFGFAQVPNKMSYQAVIRNSNNTVVSNHAVGMRISILQGTATGSSVYAETQSPTTNTNGLIAIEIGTGTIVSGSFANIDWANGPYFVKTETDPNGGTNYTLTGTSQLLSVPYALYAKTAGNIENKKHYIGEYFGGGIIFHIWNDSIGVEHGLIVDKYDLSINGIVWSNISNLPVGYTSGNTATSHWDGMANSIAIANDNGSSNCAALLCLNSTNNGYNDWYLPSILELNLLLQNYYAVSKSISQNKGASLLSHGWYYWSSTELGPGTAIGTSFGLGTNINQSKYITYYVRAIRSF